MSPWIFRGISFFIHYADVHSFICPGFPALIRKQRTAELHLGDFLVFLRRVVSSKAIQSKMASPKWTEVLLNIAAQKCCSGRGPTAFRLHIRQIQQRFETLVGNVRRRSVGGELENSSARSSCSGGCLARLREQHGR